MKILTLIRGVPGSGKSTLAKRLVGLKEFTARHIEADMFFVTSDGSYHFMPKKIKSAHEWCQNATKVAMEDGVDEIVVSNTFVKQWEMKAYRELAEAHGYKVVEIICHGDFESVHNVPIETIDRMRENFEYRG